MGKVLYKAIKNYIPIFIAFLISILFYYPSIYNFYSHDDFFNIRLASANSLAEFLGFFSLLEAPLDFGFYRPLTTQVFFLMGKVLFNLNPIGLHLITFVFFLGVLILVYKLALKLFKSRFAAFISIFLYSTSATHFGHFYYLSAFQEIGLTFFYLFTVYIYWIFIESNNKKYYFITLVFFISSLMSKESAVTLPFILILLTFYLKKFSLKDVWKSIKYLIPIFTILIVYLYLHFFHYGVAKGDSYIWDFSPRFLNTIMWYLLWSLNLPEMLVDFIGPMFSINPNLFIFYGNKIIPILVLFSIILSSIVTIFLLNIRNVIQKMNILFFSFSWFLVTLFPVIFLPWHKFTYELTLPLFGVVVFITLILNELKSHKKIILGIFLVLWSTLSFLTINHTVKTHWITQGGEAAKRVHEFIESNPSVINKTIIFIDTDEDSSLPWKPSGVMKNILSDDNFFDVYYNGKIKATYGNDSLNLPQDNVLRVKARDFLNY